MFCASLEKKCRTLFIVDKGEEVNEAIWSFKCYAGVLGGSYRY